MKKKDPFLAPSPADARKILKDNPDLATHINDGLEVSRFNLANFLKGMKMATPSVGLYRLAALLIKNMADNGNAHKVVNPSVPSGKEPKVDLNVKVTGKQLKEVGEAVELLEGEEGINLAKLLGILTRNGAEIYVIGVALQALSGFDVFQHFLGWNIL